MVRALVVCVLACAVAQASADAIVSNLNSLQLASGGFHEIGTETADVHATSHALFLSALYGQKSQINSDDALLYVSGVENGNDYGFAKSPGATSDLESTRFALMSFLHLGQDIPHVAETADFVRSLFNVNNGLFGSFPGDAGDLKSTALAIESLSILGELEKSEVKEMLKRTKDMVAEKLVSTDLSSHFSFDEASTTPLSDNYYALYLASKSGFDFAEPEKFGAFITRLQDTDRNSPTFGGFYTGEFKTAVTAEATAHAILSLKLLGLPIGQEYGLAQYCFSRKATIAETAMSHLALAHASIFKSTLSAHVSYSTNGPYDGGEQVMEGLELTPRAVVTLFDGKLAHGGFEVTVAETGGWSSDLVFDFNSFYYVADQTYDTTGKLGDLDLAFSFSTSVYPVGDINLSVSDSRMVGYTITVEDKATSDGRDVQVGDSVMPGAEFEFSVDMSTHTNPSFHSGDFTFDFKVVDASGVVQHSSSVDGSSNSEPISVSYTLTGEDFPAGGVVFVFEASKDGQVHSSQTLVYTLQQQMVAANIVLKQSELTLGSTLLVTMDPASLKDLTTIAPYSSATAGQRKYVMDLVSPNGVTIQTVPGVANSGSVASYTFSSEVPSTLDFIGTFVLSFRHESPSGESVKLHPFDTSASELYEDASSLTVKVDASLQITDVTSEPTETDFSYGSTIPFSFALVDTVSDASVSSGSHAHVFVTVSVGTFEGTKVKAVNIGDQYQANLNIDANAVAGAAKIAIKGVGVDGQSIGVSTESGSPVEYDVTVGGDIDVASSTFSTSTSVASKTAFVATFSLSSNGNPLKNAHLYATVTTKSDKGSSVVTVGDRELSGLPITVDDTGMYSVSFTAPHSAMSSGDYTIEFTRMVDMGKAQHTGSKADSLFTIDFQHSEVQSSGLFIFPEVFVVLLLGTLYYTVSNHALLFENKKYS